MILYWYPFKIRIVFIVEGLDFNLESEVAVHRIDWYHAHLLVIGIDQLSYDHLKEEICAGDEL